jgi:hypothetical protein
MLRLILFLATLAILSTLISGCVAGGGPGWGHGGWGHDGWHGR